MRAPPRAMRDYLSVSRTSPSSSPRSRPNASAFFFALARSTISFCLKSSLIYSASVEGSGNSGATYYSYCESKGLLPNNRGLLVFFGAFILLIKLWKGSEAAEGNRVADIMTLAMLKLQRSETLKALVRHMPTVTSLRDQTLLALVRTLTAP